MSKRPFLDHRHLDVDGLLTYSQELNSEDITLPVTAKDVARIHQVVLNTVFRQATSNVKNILDNPGSQNAMTSIFEKGPGFLVAGISSRFAYAGGVYAPSLFFGDMMREKGYSKTAWAASTAFETLGGTLLEVRAAKILRPEMVNFAAGFQGAIFPFLVRNGLTWLAVPTDKGENLFQSFIKGAFAGAVSAVPDTIGSKTMYKLACESGSKICSAQELMGAMKYGFQSSMTNLPNLLAATMVRTAAGGISAMLLSEKLKEAMAEAFNLLSQKIAIQGKAEPSQAVGDVQGAEKLTSSQEAEKTK